MSSSSNISDSLTKFGASDGDTAVLVAAVGEEARLEEARQAVTGDWVQVVGEKRKYLCAGLKIFGPQVEAGLGGHTDPGLLTKLHKLKAEELKDLTGALCSRVAAKDAL